MKKKSIFIYLGLLIFVLFVLNRYTEYYNLYKFEEVDIQIPVVRVDGVFATETTNSTLRLICSYTPSPLGESVCGEHMETTPIYGDNFCCSINCINDNLNLSYLGYSLRDITDEKTRRSQETWKSYNKIKDLIFPKNTHYFNINIYEPNHHFILGRIFLDQNQRDDWNASEWTTTKYVDNIEIIYPKYRADFKFDYYSSSELEVNQRKIKSIGIFITVIIAGLIGLIDLGKKLVDIYNLE